MQYRKYEIWHDESKEGGYHHGILFVPLDKRDEIVGWLKKNREKYSIPDSQEVKFAGSLKKRKFGRIVRNNLAFFSHITKTNKYNIPTRIYNLSEKNKYEGYKDFMEVVGSFGCRFGLLKIENNLESLYSSIYANKVETTFNFILRGCCHGMFDVKTPIEIIKFYFDGNEHYGRSVDLNRISGGQLRDYVKLSKNVSVDSKQRGEREDDTGLMIDFVDNIVGAFRSKLNRDDDEYNILYPLSEIWERLVNGEIFLNSNSRWHRSISFSELCINKETGATVFPSIFKNPNQQELF